MSPADSYQAKVYNQNGQFVTDSSGYVISPGNGDYLDLLSVQVDSRGSFLYVCAQNENAPFNQAVYIYSLERGVLAGTAPYPFNPPTLLLASNDPAFFQGECN
jgi:hypothetical protein